MDSGLGRHIDVVLGDEAKEAGGPDARPWIGVLFECCGAYLRIYRDPAIDRYEGKCPECGRQVRVKVGPGGVKSRVFRATPC